jgi:hypothetical protein
MSSRFLIILAVVFAAAAAVISVIFLMPVPVLTASGTILDKTFKPAGTYWQYPAGLNRGFQTATSIPVGEANVFRLAVDGFDAPVFFSLNTIAGSAFEVGQKVQINYKERVIPLVFRRVYILEMSSTR